MRKLIVTCQCGQRMQVPRSAVGKTGLCPTCGQIVTISNDTATPTGTQPKGQRPLHAKQVWWDGRNAPPEDAKRKFGEAVDLYYAGRYGEALAIFDALARQFPGNPDIENGRTQCMAALRRPPAALEDHAGGRTPESASGTAPSAAPARREGAFDAETVRQVILEKMLYGSTEAVQLQACELAARLLGMFAVNGATQPAEPAKEAAPTASEPAAEEKPVPAGETAAGPADDISSEVAASLRSRTPMPSESDLERDRRPAIGL